MNFKPIIISLIAQKKLKHSFRLYANTQPINKIYVHIHINNYPYKNIQTKKTEF